MLVQLDEVQKSYGGVEVLRGISFQVNAGDRIGLVGWNGAGKTTILRLLARREEPDGGRIVIAKGLRLGFLEQQPNLEGRKTVREEALAVFSELRAIEEEIARLERVMGETSGDVLDEAMRAYSDLRHNYELHGGFTYVSQAEAVLFGLGFTQVEMSRTADNLSGGQKSRLALARLLLAAPDLLLLDEPTNHLDIQAVEWLEGFLAEYKSAFILVSHDRFLLDRVSARIVEIEDGRATAYSGNYTAYVRQREERRQTQARQYEEQRQMIARAEEFIRRNIAGQKTNQAKSRRKMLARLDRIEAVRNHRTLGAGALKIQPAPTGVTPLAVTDLSIGYGDSPLARGISFSLRRGERLGVIGPNGCGKTTLLKTLYGLLEPLSGDLVRSVKAQIGYFDQELGTLGASGAVIDELAGVARGQTEESLRSLLARFLFIGDDVFKPVSALSGGERSRLALAKLLAGGPNVLILDEPTNHLDIPSREALESALADYAGSMIVVSHDRYFMDKIATEILCFEKGSATHHLGGYSRYCEIARGNEVATRVQPERPRPARKNSTMRSSGATRGRSAAEIEAEIGPLEEELSSLAEELAHPDSAWGPDQYTAMGDRQIEISSVLERLYGEWELAIRDSPE